jgi:hypothetical protein
MNYKYLKYEPLIKLAEELPIPPKNVIDEAFKIADSHQHEENQKHLEEDSYEIVSKRESDNFWPNLSSEIKEEFLPCVKEEMIKMKNYDWSKCLGLPISLVESYTSECGYFKYLDGNEIIWQWVEKNIPYKIDNISVFTLYGGKKILPHQDFAKNQLNMIIECNDETINYVYEPKKEFQHLNTNAYSFVPYERIDVVQEIKVEKNKWYYFPATRIHSIENINNTRRVGISLIIDNNYII